MSALTGAARRGGRRVAARADAGPRGARPVAARAGAAAGAAVAAAALLLIAGCAMTISAGSAVPLRAVSGRQTPNLSRIPVAGSRHQSLVLARWMFTHLARAAGSMAVHPRSLPWPLRRADLAVGIPTSVDLHGVFWLPLSYPAAVAFLTAHVPAGDSPQGTGLDGNPEDPSAETVTFALTVSPPGVQYTELDATVAPGPRGGSLMRVDSQVVWYPPRSAAEHIDPADYRAVALSATLENPKLHTVSATITSAAVIARLASLLNGLHAVTLGLYPMHCPLIDAIYQVTFVASSRSRSDVVVEPSGCGPDEITADRQVQPLLWDPEQRLITLAHRLLRLPAPSL